MRAAGAGTAGSPGAGDCCCARTAERGNTARISIRKMPAGSTLLTIELRYQQSLVNMVNSDDDAYDETLAPRLRSSGFQLLASVLFPRLEVPAS